MSEYFNLNLLWNARWSELYLFLTHGNPPLILMLLGINTIFFMLYVVRRATQRHKMRASTVYWVQGIMVAANAFLLFRDETLRYIMMAKGIL